MDKTSGLVVTVPATYQGLISGTGFKMVFGHSGQTSGFSLSARVSSHSKITRTRVSEQAKGIFPKL